MKFAWVGFEREINEEIVIDVLKNKFSLSNCYEYELEYLPELLDKLNLSHVDEKPSIVFYQVIKSKSEFPIIWEFISFPDIHGVARSELVIAYYLAQALNCITITDGSGFGLDTSEYWDIVFDKGKAFLVADLDTKFAGDGDNLLKYVKELELKEIINTYAHNT